MILAYIIILVLEWLLSKQLLCFYNENFESEYPFGNFLKDSKFD